jgi:hypothetical protein
MFFPYLVPSPFHDININTYERIPSLTTYSPSDKNSIFAPTLRTAAVNIVPDDIVPITNIPARYVLSNVIPSDIVTVSSIPSKYMLFNVIIRSGNPV